MGGPMKNHKSIGFLSNTGLDPLKNHKTIPSTKAAFRAGPPAECHLNAFSGIWIFSPLIN